jgi:signal peptidase I
MRSVGGRPALRTRVVRPIVYGLFLAAGLVALAPSVLAVAGLTPLTVRGTSMSPTLHDGDAILTRSVTASAIEVGDVVTFPYPHPDGKVVTHRVIEQERSGTTLSFVTQGDSSPGVERWSIASTARVGLHAIHVPHLGRVAGVVAGPQGKATGLALTVFFLVRKGVLDARTTR